MLDGSMMGRKFKLRKITQNRYCITAGIQLSLWCATSLHCPYSLICCLPESTTLLCPELGVFFLAHAAMHSSTVRRPFIVVRDLGPCLGYQSLIVLTAIRMVSFAHVHPFGFDRASDDAVGLAQVLLQVYEAAAKEYENSDQKVGSEELGWARRSLGVGSDEFGAVFE